MKTLIIILITAVIIGAGSPVWAQSEQYKTAMTNALATVSRQSPKTPVAEMVAAANQFERIAGAEPNQWLPRYYAALEYVYCGFSGKSGDEKDQYLDKADALLKQADAISPKNDELLVLKAYIAQSRLAVNPMIRWMTYGGAFDEALKQAKTLNANNPRIYLLQGSNLMYTPKLFGGGSSAALPALKQAIDKFATAKPNGEFAPAWGRQQTEKMLEKCKATM
jgi:hypothetical protein